MEPESRPSSTPEERGPQGPLFRGLRVGDGVFETVRTYYGRPFRLEQHLRRLSDSAEHIGLRDRPSPSELTHAILDQLGHRRAQTPGTEWVIRAILFEEGDRSGRLIQVEPFDSKQAKGPPAGLSTGRSRYPHPGRYLCPPGSDLPVKWLARGPLAHALRDARSRGWDEALLADSEGRLVEGTRSNLVVESAGALIAPGPRSFALPGVTREVVVELARGRGLPVLDRGVTLDELRGCSSAFLTSSLLGVAPVERFEDGLLLARSRPSEISRWLLDAFQETVERESRIEPGTKI